MSARNVTLYALRPVPDELLAERAAGRLQLDPQAFQPARARREPEPGVDLVADVGDAAVAQFEQVAGRHAAALDVIDAQTRQAQAALAAAVADRDTAQLNLSYTELRAPIDGTVGNRSARAGAYATAHEGEAPLEEAAAESTEAAA